MAVAPVSLESTAMRFQALVRADLHADGKLEGSAWRRVAVTLGRITFAPRLQAVILVRIAHELGRRWPPLGAVVKYVNHVLTGCDVAHQARIGPGLQLLHPVGVVIGPDVVLGASCKLQQGVTVGAGPHGSPRIGDNVRFGPGSRVYGAITLGDGAVVGANAVVQTDAPDNALLLGVPATVRHTSGWRET